MRGKGFARARAAGTEEESTENKVSNYRRSVHCTFHQEWRSKDGESTRYGRYELLSRRRDQAVEI